MAERFNDPRFDRVSRARLATLRRIERRVQTRLEAHPDKAREEYLRADLIAVQWALKILLSDHELPLGDLIKQAQKKASFQ